jgi:1-phosphatidylinositol phosphodiesterase
MDEKQHLLEHRHAGHDDYKYDKLESGLKKTSNSHNGTKSQGNPQITGATWMSHLPSSTPMSALTIPGTHDSAAYTYSWPFIATQTLDITAQLNAGIRYFDLRCGLRADVLEMVHGQALLGLRLEQVLADMYAFLSAHPSEALIAQIKRDRKDEKSTVHFAQAITNLISATPDHWRTANTTPLLGELRSRIQLFRRFEGSPTSQPPNPPLPFAYGIDVTRWQDNPTRPFTIAHPTSNVSLTIQDHYSFPSALSLPSLIARKGGDVSELLDWASKSYNPDPDQRQNQQWFINFTSAFEFNLYYQITPREIAAGAYWAFRWEDGMNARLRNYLDSHADDDGDDGSSTRKRYGIIAMDFPEAGAKDLVTAVVRTNFEVEGKKGGWRWKKWWKNASGWKAQKLDGWKSWWSENGWNGSKWKRALCVTQFCVFSFFCFGALGVLSLWLSLSERFSAAAAASASAMQVPRRCELRQEVGSNRVRVKFSV